jgi:hypothetical protein
MTARPWLAVVIVVALLGGCRVRPVSGITDDGVVTTVTYGDAKYVIPDAFIRRGASPQPQVAATYPDFRPATQAGPSCVSWFSSKNLAACSTLDFWIQDRAEVAHQTAGVDRPLADIDPSIHRVPGPHVPLLIEFKRRRGAGFCDLTVRADGIEDGVCSEHLLLTTGDYASFDFPYHLRDRVPSIEAGVNALAAAFALNHAT